MRKWIVGVVLLLTTVTAMASLRVTDQVGAQLGIYSDKVCGPNEYCYDSGGKHYASPHYKYPVSTSTTATAALCGVTFVVTADSTITLPEASTVDAAGCRYEIVNGMSTWSSGTFLNVKVKPADSSDRIHGLALNAGNPIKNSTFGNSIIIEAIGDDAWVQVGEEVGTWTELTNGNQ